RCKMIAIAEPQRLHGRIEHAASQTPYAITLLQQIDQFRRRADKNATPVEIAKNGAGIVKGKDHLEATSLGDHTIEQTLPRRAVGMMQAYGCDTAERHALPFDQG